MRNNLFSNLTVALSISTVFASAASAVTVEFPDFDDTSGLTLRI